MAERMLPLAVLGGQQPVSTKNSRWCWWLSSDSNSNGFSKWVGFFLTMAGTEEGDERATGSSSMVLGRRSPQSLQSR